MIDAPCARCVGRGVDLAYVKTCPACGGSGHQPELPEAEMPAKISRFVERQTRVAS